MAEQNNAGKEVALENIITSAVQIPWVKVSRDKYPIVKQIGKAIGVKVTKTTVTQGFSKAIPVIGGVISGSINFASMMPMANRLQKTLDSAAFGYTEEDLEKDIIEIENITADNPAEEKDIKSKFVDSGKKAISGISGLFTKKTTARNLTR